MTDATPRVAAIRCGIQHHPETNTFRAVVHVEPLSSREDAELAAKGLLAAALKIYAGAGVEVGPLVQ